MSPDIIRADYAVLEQIASKFDEERERVQTIESTLVRHLDVLHGGAWVGDAANTFYREMDDDILPTLVRLTAALGAAGGTTRLIMQIIHEAEEKAAACPRPDLETSPVAALDEKEDGRLYQTVLGDSPSKTEFNIPFDPACDPKNYSDVSCVEPRERAEYILRFVELGRQLFYSGEVSAWNELINRFFPGLDPFYGSTMYPEELLSYDFLPYIPFSITGGSDSRRGRAALAQATQQIWSELGLFEDPEELVAWVNQHEHSILRGNEAAISYMNEFIHYTYFVTAQGDRETFLAIWSVALFEQRNPVNPDGRRITVEGRTYEFLTDILSPVDPDFIVRNDLDWGFDGEADLDFINSQYSPELLADLGATPNGQLRTFGSTELDSPYEQCFFRNHPELYLLSFQGAGNAVYIMSPAQWNIAREMIGNVPANEERCL